MQYLFLWVLGAPNPRAAPGSPHSSYATVLRTDPASEKLGITIACLQLCSGSHVGRWWKPCSYRLKLLNDEDLVCSEHLGVQLENAGSWVIKSVFWPSPRWTHPARVAVVALEATDVVRISRKAATGRATWRHLSSFPLLTSYNY